MFEPYTCIKLFMKLSTYINNICAIIKVDICIVISVVQFSSGYWRTDFAIFVKSKLLVENKTSLFSILFPFSLCLDLG